MDTNDLTDEEKIQLFHALEGAKHALIDAAHKEINTEPEVLLSFLDQAEYLESLRKKLLPDFEAPLYDPNNFPNKEK